MQKLKTQKLTLVALMAAVMCILGPMTIVISISPVPLSFANLAIYLAVTVLGWKLGTLSCLVYLMIGFVGIPVFSGFASGPGKLLGPTGGYLIGYIFLALIGGFFAEIFKDRFGMILLGMGLGTLVLYAFGTVWLAFQADLTFKQALIAGVVPYIPGDAVKIYLGVFVGRQIRQRTIV